MRTVFLDTGYLIALELASDQNHWAAADHWRKIKESLPHLVTTSVFVSDFFEIFIEHLRDLTTISFPSNQFCYYGALATHFAQLSRVASIRCPPPSYWPDIMLNKLGGGGRDEFFGLV